MSPTVNHKEPRVSTTETTSAVAWENVRRRPVYHPELGSFFRELRKSQGWTLRQAGDIAHRRGLTSLSRQVLFRLERGQTKNPEPEVLQALAKLYNFSYSVLVGRLTKARYGLDAYEVRAPKHELDKDEDPLAQQPESQPHEFAAPPLDPDVIQNLADIAGHVATLRQTADSLQAISERYMAKLDRGASPATTARRPGPRGHAR